MATATQTNRALVFLSAHANDARYRDGLRQELSDYPEVECWDHTQLKADLNWDDQIKEALDRASVAAVFFSPAYLASPETGEYELNVLGDYAKTKGLTLFPILVEECEWRRYPFLRDLEVWGHDKPLSSLSEDALGVEYEKIAAAIRELVSGVPKLENKTSEDFNFSTSANLVFSAAGSLALKSNRGRVTTSSLLFALAGSEWASTPMPPTLEFVRTALNKTGVYKREFETYLKDGRPSTEQTVASISGTSWMMTANSREIVRRAAEIARLVSENVSDVVHVRHLFASLLTSIGPDGAGSRSVRERLKRLGVDEVEFRAEFREHVGIIAPSDHASAWDFFLGTARVPQFKSGTDADPQQVSPLNELDFKSTYSAFIPDRTSYGRKVPGELLDDSLNVRTYASHLAQVIAAKDTAMPLSIGLFGAWGAGKSHFIDLLDEQLNELKKQPGNAFHKQIVPIRFNAWHYLDTNLWASLVSEIFDQLFTFLESPEAKEQAKLENLKKQIADQSALAAEAKAAVTKAQNVRIEAEAELRTAVLARIEEEGKVSRLLDDLSNLPIAVEVQNQLRDVAKALGLPKLERSYKELEARADEVRSLSGRIKALVLAVFTGPGWWVRATLFIVALVSPLIVSWLALHGAPWVKDLLAGTGRTIAQVITAIAALSTWLAAQVKAGNSIVTKLEGAYDQVAKVRADREATDRAAKAQAALAEKKQAEEEARHTLHEAEEKLKTIKAELAELAPGRQLMRFLRERATAEDYRRHLGLVSLVRQDFKQLSDLMTAPKVDAPPQANAALNADGSPRELPPELPVIDRIILYIDDLDRCRADRVIEVLEAVHLLLAFPLFAVVVAVDPRWLRQSLLDHYPRLLGGADADGTNARTRSLGRPATPQDYLEKIFQVPFNLQPMEKTGYELLVDHLFSSNGSKPPPPPQNVPATENRERLTETPKTETTKVEEGTSPSTPVVTHPVIDPQPQPTTKQTPAPPADPERLVLTGKEIADVKRFQLLFQTPRAVKRLANTYSLIRVGVGKSEWSNYLGTADSAADYRVPLLLLAVTSAFPALARPWLLWLRNTPPAQWQIDDTELARLIESNADTTASAEWEKLQHCLKAVKLDGWPPPDPETLAQWVPRVARYSF
jgi:hypothetical protein